MVSLLSRKVALEVLVGHPCSLAGCGMLSISEEVSGQRLDLGIISKPLLMEAMGEGKISPEVPIK